MGLKQAVSLGIKPGKKMWQGQGMKPWTYKKDHALRPGDRTLDLQKHAA